MEQSSSIFSFRVIRTPLIIISLYILLEIAFRLVSFGGYATLNWLNYNPRGILVTDNVMPVPETGVSWKLRPNLQTIFKTKQFTTNSVGFRGPELQDRDSSETTRIVILGRSVAMGAGVSDYEVYSQILQNYLNAWQPGQYEVINCAVGGYSIQQMLNFYEYYVKPLNADIILIPLAKDDMIIDREPPIRPLAMAKPGPTNLRAFLGYTFSFVSMEFIIRRLSNKLISPDWNQRSAEIHHPEDHVISSKKILADFVEERSNEGVPCFLYAADRNSTRDIPKDQILKRWTEEHSGAYYLAVNEYMDGKFPKKSTIYFGDNHPSAQVHALLGEALYHMIRKFVAGQR